MTMDKRLPHCQTMQYVRHVGWINQRVLTQIALALAALACQNMTAVGLLALDGTAAGYFEPLFGTTVCLHLWHDYTPCSAVSVPVVVLSASAASVFKDSFFFGAFFDSGASITPRKRPSMRIG